MFSYDISKCKFYLLCFATAVASLRHNFGNNTTTTDVFSDLLWEQQVFALEACCNFWRTKYWSNTSLSLQRRLLLFASTDWSQGVCRWQRCQKKSRAKVVGRHFSVCVCVCVCAVIGSCYFRRRWWYLCRTSTKTWQATYSSIMSAKMVTSSLCVSDNETETERNEVSSPVDWCAGQNSFQN